MNKPRYTPTQSGALVGTLAVVGLLLLGTCSTFEGRTEKEGTCTGIQSACYEYYVP